jgi:hypothetical protein
MGLLASSDALRRRTQLTGVLLLLDLWRTLPLECISKVPPERARPRAQQAPTGRGRKNILARRCWPKLLRPGTGALRLGGPIWWYFQDALVRPELMGAWA